MRLSRVMLIFYLSINSGGTYENKGTYSLQGKGKQLPAPTDCPAGAVVTEFRLFNRRQGNDYQPEGQDYHQERWVLIGKLSASTFSRLFYPGFVTFFCSKHNNSTIFFILIYPVYRLLYTQLCIRSFISLFIVGYSFICPK